MLMPRLRARVLRFVLLLAVWSTNNLASSLLLDNGSGNHQIIVCSSSIELERAIDFFVKPTDSVLEIGAQLSDTSLQIQTIIQSKSSDSQSGGKALFVEGPSDVRMSGRTKHNRRHVDAFDPTTVVTLQNLEGWREEILCKQQQEDPSRRSSYDVVVVDLAHMVGNDLALTTLSWTNDILSKVTTNDNPPRITLVKSKSLSSLARRIIPYQQLMDGTSIIDKDDEYYTRTNAPLIIASVGVAEYRRTIPFVLTPGDAVIEVGCHAGYTTAILAEATTEAGLCIGVDIGPKIIKAAQKEYPHVQFHVGDAWKTFDLLQLRTDGTLGYDLVYVDVGGLSGAYGILDSLALLDSLANALQPKCIVIKSLCMRRLATKLRAFSDIWSKQIPRR